MLLVLLVAPICLLAWESARPFVPGGIGAAAGLPYTWANYLALGHWAYLGYLATTFWMALLASVSATAVGYLMAHRIVRMRSARWRKAAIGLLVLFVFVSALVKIYALQLSFGPVGFIAPLLRRVGIASNSSAYIRFMVWLGLFQATLPTATLVLVGTIQSIGSRIEEAAMVLGATKWRAQWDIVLPLARRGLVSALLISFSYGISAFIVPMILGRGRVTFISNVIYARFSDLSDYPGGAAISMVMLVLSCALLYGISRGGAARGA